MTARTRKIRTTAKPRVGKYLVLGALAISIALFGALFVSGINLIVSWLEDLPDYSDADAYLLAEPTTVLDAQGNVIAEFYAENRTPIGIEACSPYLLQATIDIEDERFYSHHGVDYRGIGRAIASQLFGGSQGASTITQQLVRNTVLKDEQFEHSLRRKLREAYISIQLEKIYTKDQILMMYLNSIYYGAGCYGIEAASETFFGKTASQLSLAEAATIAGLPQSPSAYDPTVNPELALERRNLVLYRMLANGDIDEATYDQTVAQPLQLHYSPRASSGAFQYPYFVDYVRRLLDNQFGSDILLKGGLTVKTTIDPVLQQKADAAVHSVIDLATDGLEAALVAIDPADGSIDCMFCGRDYTVDQWNLATQAKRQPGSSFKAFTLAAAIQAGMNPNTYIDGSSPLTIGDWTLSNFGHQSYGILTLRDATWMSCNTVYAQVIHELGPQTVVDMAHALGVKTELGAYDSLTLGTTECSVLEMASAYSTFAANGTYYEPYAIAEVDDRNGNILFKHEAVGTQAISPEVAYAVTGILEGVINGSPYMSTGIEAALTVDQPVAGKTGTTDDTSDLWFCGYTPQLACAVWTGYRTTTTIYYQGALGSTHVLPSPIFSRFMSSALEGLPRQEFQAADSPTYLPSSAWSFGLGSYVYVPYVPSEDELEEEEQTEQQDQTDSDQSQSEESGDGDSEWGYTETEADW